MGAKSLMLGLGMTILVLHSVVNRTLSVSIHQISRETENQAGNWSFGPFEKHNDTPLNNKDDGNKKTEDLEGNGELPVDGTTTKGIVDVVEGSVDDQVIAEVPPEFLSITVNARLPLHNWSTFDTSSPRLRAMSRALSPAILRMGGSSANFLTFEPNSRPRPSIRPQLSREDGTFVADDNSRGLEMEEDSSSLGNPDDCNGEMAPNLTNFTIFEDDWVRLNEFVKAVGWHLLFDLNQFYRDSENNWDPSNALQLINSAQDKGYVNILWQLGNEPNAYKHHFNFSITGKQMAEDVMRLRYELKKFFPKMYRNTLIMGPDITRPKNLRSQEMDVAKKANVNGLVKGEAQANHNTSNGDLSSDFENDGRNHTLDSFSSESFHTTQPQYHLKKKVWNTLRKSLEMERKTKKLKVHENSIYAAFTSDSPSFKHYRKNKDSLNSMKESIHKRQESSNGLGHSKYFYATSDTKANFSSEQEETKITLVDCSKEIKDANTIQVAFCGNSEQTKSEKVVNNGETRETKSKQFEDIEEIKETSNEEKDSEVRSKEISPGQSFFNIKPGIGIQDLEKKGRENGTNIKPNSTQKRKLEEGKMEEKTRKSVDEEKRETKDGGCPEMAGEDGETTIRINSVEFLKDFLINVGDNIDVISWHQYYIDGHTAEVEDFLSTEVLDLFPQQQEIIMHICNAIAPKKPIWLTETGSAFGGGAPNLSNRFAASFMYLDKLGLAAEGGVSVVARQSFYQGHYAMIGDDLMPNPDFWVAVLYKRLVGQRVLRFLPSGPVPNVRLYASCASNYTSYYRPGAVVVYGVNLGATEVEVHLQGRLTASPIFQFLLQPAFGKLTDRDIMLNGRPIEIVNDNLPDLGPLETLPGVLQIPPHSLGFWLLKDAHMWSCY
ncbi:uncharacterized protein LOC143020393 [Oratosquilla oratoria]|uniref:uncharacterized protein LOC143020393 n=1 Tax=Oratosquilla oratoria TaxID=337810 RepID=UPI003F757DD8